MNKYKKEDLYRYIGNDCHSFLKQLKYLIFTPGFRYVYFYSHASMASNVIKKLFWKFCVRMCMYRTGIQIQESTKIGRGFRIVHFGTIVVNPGTVIGNNFNLAEGTLIGNSQGKYAGVTTIGDIVCLNVNSIVVGR